jgi:small conductance mechanosensitive channel
MAVERRAERSRMIQRVEIVIDSVEAKGGDVTEARAYVDSVVVTPPITGARAFWVTSLAWMTNEAGGLALARRIGMALGVLFASWIVAKFLGGLARRGMRKVRKTSELLRGFVAISVQRMVLILGTLVALGQLGVNMGPWLAAIGAAGLVVGLALQGTLSNFASGIMIMIYRPFDIGDVISTAGPTGTVRGMTLVTTTVMTFDNQTVFIPNNMVWGNVITNLTASSTRRVDLVIGIGYGDDVSKAKQVLMDVITAHESVLAEPKPNVQVHELGDSSVNFVVRPWVKTSDYWDVYWDLTQAIKERLDAEGISIPFPQRDVHMIPVGSGEPGVWIQPAPAAGENQPAPTSSKDEPANANPGEQ